MAAPAEGEKSDESSFGSIAALIFGLMQVQGWKFGDNSPGKVRGMSLYQE